MRKQFAILLGILLPAIIYVSCRRNLEPNNEALIDNTGDFFQGYESSPSSVKRVAEKIKQQDSKHHFISRFIKEQGIAKWNNSIIMSGTNASALNRGGKADSLLFIPLVRSPFKEVHGFLACLVGEDSVKIRLFDGSMYNAYPFNKGIDTLSAHLIAATTMFLHHNVFGDSTFLIKDDLLFDRPAFRGNGRTLTFRTSPNGLGSFYLGTTITCIPVHEARNSIHIASAQICWEYNNWQEIVDPSMPGGTQIPGGGGSTGSGWWDQNPCRLAEAIDPPGGSGSSPNCGNNGNITGWLPVPIGDPFFPAENLLGPYVSPEDDAMINLWKVLNIDTTQLDSCRRLILRKMLNTTHAMGRLLTKLDKALGDSNYINKFQIKYMNDATLPVTKPGWTTNMNYNAFDKTFTAEVHLSDSAIMSATDIYMSQVICHETVHAYLTYILMRLRNHPTQQNITLSYYSAFNDYVDSLKNRSYGYLANIPVATYQHNYMANHLLDFYANSLAEYDEERIGDQEYYWYMAWAGLEDTPLWRSFWPNFNNVPITAGAPATSNSDKRGLSYALTSTRLLANYNARISELLGDNDARGKKPAVPGSGNCYQ